MGLVSDVVTRATGTLWAIMNPVAKGYAVTRRVLEHACQDADLPAPVVLTTRPDADGYPQAREAVAAGARTILVGGGDGTLREVVRAVAGTGVELGILPIGTANLFAYNLRLRTRQPLLAVDRALFSPARAVDLGWASWRHVDAEGRVGLPTAERPFLVMAGLGYDAATVRATSPALKKQLGWLSYLASGSRHLLARPLEMRVSLNNAPGRRLRTWTLLVANAGRIPGGIEVFPGAALDDGVLDVLEVPLRKTAQWGGIAFAGLTRHRVDTTALRYTKARTLWAVPDEPAPLHLDGDTVGHVADLRVRVQQGGLLVRAPEPS